MRVLMISFTSLLQRGYRKKCDEIAREPGVDLTVLTPEYWKEHWSSGRRVAFEPGEGGEAYRSVQLPVVFAGNGHVSFFRGGIGGLFAEVRPHIIDLEREPWCWASAQVLWLQNRRAPESRLIFHASQNALKWYPPPFRQIETAIYRRAKCALARSERAAEVLRARGYRGKLRRIPHGVDTGLFAPVAGPVVSGEAAPDPREPVVGFAGALTRQKGVDVLLDAISRLRSPARGLVVGDGPERHRLHDLASELGLGGRVDFVGVVSHREMPAYYRRMSVFTLPAISVPGHRERFGRVLLEAMATGLPVVGTDSGEIPQVLGDAGVVVREGSASRLAEAIDRILQDRREAKRLGDRARKRVEQEYSWAVIAKRTVEAYRDIIGA